MSKCPSCGEDGIKVLYRIFPMVMCVNEECEGGDVWGFWSWVLEYHFDGFFIACDSLSYFGAVWFWLSGKADRGE